MNTLAKELSLVYVVREGCEAHPPCGCEHSICRWVCFGIMEDGLCFCSMYKKMSTEEVIALLEQMKSRHFTKQDWHELGIDKWEKNPNWK